MSEERQLIVPFAVIFIIGVAGYLTAAYLPYSGDLVVESYDVSFSPLGHLTETYLFDVGISGKYSMLFRVWKAPLIAPDGQDPDIASYKSIKYQLPARRYPLYKRSCRKCMGNR